MARLLKSLVILASLLLASCAGAGQSTPVALPLATHQPTFIFVYTDN